MKELSAFLETEGVPADLPADAGGSDDGGATPPPVADAVAPDPAPTQAADAAPVAPVADDPDAIPGDMRGVLEALQATRAKRNDYKTQAAKAEGELLATKAQLAELLKAKETPPAPVATQPPPQQYQPPPNPLEDPVGYQNYMDHRIEMRAINDKLNFSEDLMREQKPDLDEKIEVFKKAVAANPALGREFAAHRHPYRFLYQQAEKMIALSEVGDDPAAYRARIAAELRAEIEAEYAAKAPPPPPTQTLHIPRSLGTAPSSAPRVAEIEGPDLDNLDSILPRRRRA